MEQWSSRRWSKWANALFKVRVWASTADQSILTGRTHPSRVIRCTTTDQNSSRRLLLQKDKPLGSEPWFNPEAVTEQKVKLASAAGAAACCDNGVDYGCTGTAASMPSGFGYSGHRQWEHWQCLSRVGDSAPVGCEACSHHGGLSPGTNVSPALLWCFLQREWMEQRKAKEVQAVTWPEHIYENFFIVVSTPLVTAGPVAVVDMPTVAHYWSAHGICRKVARTVQAQQHSHIIASCVTTGPTARYGVDTGGRAAVW